MLCMCSTSPSNAEITRDASKEAILWEKFGFEIVEVAAARSKRQHSRPNTRKRPDNHIASNAMQCIGSAALACSRRCTAELHSFVASVFFYQEVNRFKLQTTSHCVFIYSINTDCLSVYFNTCRPPNPATNSPQKAEGGGGANALSKPQAPKKLHHFVPFKSAEASVC
jgi:hypothetical protein